MQVIQINKSKLEVHIEKNDLIQNNISVFQLLSSPILKQKFFYNILSNIFKQTSFNLNNSRLIVETFFVSSISKFVIVITKTYYNTYINKKFFNYLFFVGEFNCLQDVCIFCKALNIKTSSSLYRYKNTYYLKIKLRHIRYYNKIYYTLKEYTNYSFLNCFINENAKLVIKDNAIEICKEFV